jgi:hypothetical protein
LEDTLNLPVPEPLPGVHDPSETVPYYILADDAFALKPWLQKPYSSRHLHMNQRIFNYRLSRARRVVENAFGILAGRFRCLLTAMPQKPETVTKIVLAACVLHNLLRTRQTTEPVGDTSLGAQGGDLASWMHDAHLDGNMSFGRRMRYESTEGKRVRDYLNKYFNDGPGYVDWQQQRVFTH